MVIAYIHVFGAQDRLVVGDGLNLCWCSAKISRDRHYVSWGVGCAV